MDLKKLAAQLREAATLLDNATQTAVEEPKEKLPETYNDIPEETIRAGMEAVVKCHPDIEKPMRVLSVLYDLRQEYWRIAGNWKPDWEDEDQPKFVIQFVQNKPINSKAWYTAGFLVFPTQGQAEHFYEHHRDLIEQAQPLL